MSSRTTLVSARELAAHPQWRAFDCRHDLGDPGLGARQYQDAHIPGALHAHLDRDLSATPDGAHGRHPLPDPVTFLAWLGRQGLQSSDQVVLYDASGGMYAARLWWMLRWVGHQAVAVLDGGLPQWVAEGHPLVADIPRFQPCVYLGGANSDMQVAVSFIESNLDTGEALLLDARSADRFAGRGETLDRVGGHIPGARNRYFGDNLTTDGLFKSATQLREDFLEVLQHTPARRVVAQCGSGVTACHNLLAMEIAGLQGARLYPGSWSEWCSHPGRPVE